MSYTNRIWKAIPKLTPTDEADYVNRRSFMKKLGVGASKGAAVGAMSGLAIGCLLDSDALFAQDLGVDEKTLLAPGLKGKDILAKFPAKRDKQYDKYMNGGKAFKLTDAKFAAIYNNFYEFTTRKTLVWRLAQKFTVDPWTIEVTGECKKPAKLDIDKLMKLPQEERVYRFRCVETWAMDVPWTGIQLSDVLKLVEPTSKAKYVRFTTAMNKKEMPGIDAAPGYPWPYFEGLTIDEAMNELTLLGTGIYGKPLPKQMGAPFRLVVPWKYGYKSIKSIVKIELLEDKPTTFWEKLQPAEYPFESNIEPKVPHPRWSQAKERLIGTGEVRPTLLYGGYGDFVAKLYKK